MLQSRPVRWRLERPERRHGARQCSGRGEVQHPHLPTTNNNNEIDTNRRGERERVSTVKQLRSHGKTIGSPSTGHLFRFSHLPARVEPGPALGTKRVLRPHRANALLPVHPHHARHHKRRPFAVHRFLFLCVFNDPVFNSSSRHRVRIFQVRSRDVRCLKCSMTRPDMCTKRLQAQLLRTR